MFTKIKRVLIGEPLSNSLLHSERIPKWKALATLSSDALSSVAYATEEILIPLSIFSVAAASWSMPIALGIATLLTIVTISYRQTISAYPSGGGAYIVARENLGVLPGLVAGGALLIDYVLTVAVSIAAGVAAVTSAFPGLHEHKAGLAIFFIVILTIMNLRGLKESSTVFAFPTYAFIASVYGLIGVGVWKLATGTLTPAAPLLHEVYPEIPLFLLLRAFSSGCAALTGIEAISNGVTAFRDPVTKNAKTTMTWMSFLLATLFLGITLLIHALGLMPREGETLVSQLARSIFGEHGFYYVIQATTALILVLAANTAYTGFPMLASLLAKDRYLPRQLASLGDKLVFSNGIVGLSVAATVLILLFDVDTHFLVPLYAVGVFLSFTLSQLGMVIHHFKDKEPGWLRSAAFNALGGVTTLVVLFVIGSTKFLSGAWIVILVIPILVLGFYRVFDHYIQVGRELSLIGVPAPGNLEKLKHTVIIPISGVHRGVIDALRYAISISDDVRACYVELDSAATERMQAEWNRWAHEVPLVILKSPYRSVITPILEYINDVDQVTHNEMITVIIPEFVTARWYHRLLHNQTALIIRAALSFRKGKVVTSVRYHLKAT
jgi:amino acid transporter